MSYYIVQRGRSSPPLPWRPGGRRQISWGPYACFMYEREESLHTLWIFVSTLRWDKQPMEDKRACKDIADICFNIEIDHLWKTRELATILRRVSSTMKWQTLDLEALPSNQEDPTPASCSNHRPTKGDLNHWLPDGVRTNIVSQTCYKSKTFCHPLFECAHFATYTIHVDTFATFCNESWLWEIAALL